jgi:pimeloyl-ACP methyl ester carboxylesterase
VEEAVIDQAERGPDRVETRDVEVARPGSDDAFTACCFIPQACEAGAAASRAAPVFAFGHGFLAPVDVYRSTLAHLASWGIIVVAPRSERVPLPDHDRFTGDLLAALDAVVAMATTDDWPGRPVDPAARAVGGHSMGGGAAVLAAAADARVRTVATVNAADTRPSAIEAAARVTVPILLLASSEDRVAPPDKHQRPMFEAAAGPAQLRTIEGGGHCGILDQADLISLVCGRSSLPTDVQRVLGQTALLAWLRAELLHDQVAAQDVWRPRSADHVTVEVRGVDAR